MKSLQVRYQSSLNQLKLSGTATLLSGRIQKGIMDINNDKMIGPVM